MWGPANLHDNSRRSHERSYDRSIHNAGDAARATDDEWEALKAAFEEKRGLLRAESDKIAKGQNELKRKREDLMRENGDINADDSDLLDVNAGGEIVTVTRKILTQFKVKGTWLEALFSGRWENGLLRDTRGRIFLDVNPSCFRRIVDYLTEWSISPPTNPPGPPLVDTENEVFLTSLLSIFGLTEVIQSATLDQGQINVLHEFLEEEDGQLNLLYRASRDGWRALDFHTKCDNKGATLTVIRTVDGYVFGGYINVPWTKKNVPYSSYQGQRKAFLFALRSHSQVGPMKMRQKKLFPLLVEYHHPNHGPTFGLGAGISFDGPHDIYVADNANSNTESYTALGITFECPSGHNGQTFFTGSRHFQAAEVEVFVVDSSKRCPPWMNCDSVTTTSDDAMQQTDEPWQKATFDEFPEKLKIALKNEQQALITERKELMKQEHLFEMEKIFIDYFVQGNTEDIAQLDVRGKLMAVKRSTLGLCEESALAKQFNDPLWTQRAGQPVSEWNSEQVTEWAAKVEGMPKTAVTTLRRNRVTGADLIEMGREDLKDIGIAHPKVLAVITQAIKQLHRSTLENATFIDHSDYCFGRIVDQLRLRAMCRPRDVLPPAPYIRKPDRKRFKRTLDYYFPGESAAFILGTD